jgi:hypothetical protein
VFRRLWGHFAAIYPYGDDDEEFWDVVFLWIVARVDLCAVAREDVARGIATDTEVVNGRIRCRAVAITLASAFFRTWASQPPSSSQ